MTDIVFRHPDYPTGPCVGYFSAIDATGAEVTLHFYECGHEGEALTAARHVADRNHIATVWQWRDGMRERAKVYSSRSIKHDVKPGAAFRAGSYVTVKRDGKYIQEEV